MSTCLCGILEGIMVSKGKWFKIWSCILDSSEMFEVMATGGTDFCPSFDCKAQLSATLYAVNVIRHVKRGEIVLQ